MGANCCARNTNKEEPDYILKETYTSVLDSRAEEFEKEYNFLKDLDLEMFIDYIFNLKKKVEISEESENPEVKQASLFLKDIDGYIFEEFVDKKIKSNPFLAETNAEDNRKNKFGNFLKDIFTQMVKIYARYLEATFNSQAKDDFLANPSLNKIIVITIGFVFCRASYKKKIEIMYNLFSKDRKMVKSDLLSQFIFILISNFSRNYYLVLNEFLEEKKAFQEEELGKLKANYNFDNILKLTNLYVTQIFGGSKELTQLDIERVFTGTDPYSLWIFQGSGVRSKLENLNNTEKN